MVYAIGVDQQLPAPDVAGHVEVDRIAAQLILAELLDLDPLQRDLPKALVNPDLSAPVATQGVAGVNPGGQRDVPADEADLGALVNTVIQLLARGEVLRPRLARVRSPKVIVLQRLDEGDLGAAHPVRLQAFNLHELRLKGAETGRCHGDPIALRPFLCRARRPPPR